MVTVMGPKVQLAIKRGYKEQYDRETGKTRHFDRNITASRGTSLNDEERAVRLPEAAFATQPAPIAEEAAECVQLLDESHRSLVGYARVIVEGFMRSTAASRREWLPQMVRFLGRLGVTTDEAGLPPQWVQKAARTTTRDLPFKRTQVFLQVVIPNLASMGSRLDSYDTCLVSA